MSSESPNFNSGASRSFSGHAITAGPSVSTTANILHHVNTDTVRRIDIDQPTSEMLAYLKEQIEDELSLTKDLLLYLSNEYEAAEKYLNRLSRNLKEIEAVAKSLTSDS